jgi:glycosyltransferase XagB
MISDLNLALNGTVSSEGLHTGAKFVNFIAHQLRTDSEKSARRAAFLQMPVLPYDLMPNLIERMTSAERDAFLQFKILPVAHLPHLTLYGTVNDVGNKRAEELGLRVVAKILPHDFQKAIHNCLAPQLIKNATFGLKRTQPEYSARHRVTLLQSIWLVTLLLLGFIASQLLSMQTLTAIASLIFGFFFLSVISVRLLSLIHADSTLKIRSKKLNDMELPVYSVLVPVFKETGVLNQLIAALTKIRYPTSKLDIKIIVEEKDVAMRVALQHKELAEHIEIILVPEGKPQTKPRALNYAMQFARGSLLTIFDAEDIPDRDQLQVAAAQFANAPEKLACLQAELTFYNPSENWLARQFTIEYAMLFKLALPSLAKEKLPLLLGGTSNHFRTTVLRAIGGWDPFNVTEDADLGMRLVQSGYITSVLDSTTYEEANVRFWNWVHQRSRWLKGFLQTWFVHMRHPRQLLQSTGHAGFWIFQANTIGIFVTALFLPFFMGHASYHLIKEDLCFSLTAPAAQFICVLNMFVFIFGYGISIAAGWRALRLKHIEGWWLDLLSLPIYWLMMTLAAWKAAWEFIVSPFKWNKTEHGLSEFQKAHDQ